MTDDMPFEPALPISLIINYAPLIMGVMIYITYRYMRNAFQRAKFTKKLLNGDFDEVYDTDIHKPLWKTDKIKQILNLGLRKSKIFGYISLVYLIMICALSLYYTIDSDVKYSFALLINTLVFCSCLYDGITSYASAKESKEARDFFDARMSADFSAEYEGFLKKEKSRSKYFIIFNILAVAVTGFNIVYIIAR